MGELSEKQSIEINVSAEKAWEIVGPNFVNIGNWGRGIIKSWENTDAPINIEGAPAGGRFCDVGKFGEADEKILHYDADKMEITWSAVISKMPGFVKNLKNQIKVESTGDNSCRVSTNITADLSGVGGLVMGGAITKNMIKLIAGFLKDWKAYAETGEVSDAKKRELEAIA